MPWAVSAPIEQNSKPALCVETCPSIYWQETHPETALANVPTTKL